MSTTQTPPAPDPVAAKAATDLAVAQARKAEADAIAAELANSKAAADAVRDRVAALVPDFTAVKTEALDVKTDGGALFGQTLGYGALAAAAAAVGEKVKQKLTTESRILVTSDEDLATADATCREVVSGLMELISAAEALLHPRPEHRGEEDLIAAPLAIEAVVAAAAKALPGVLSLLRPTRALSTHQVDLDDLSASLAVANYLADHGLGTLHDEFRLVPHDSYVLQLETTLRTRQSELVASKLSLKPASPAPSKQEADPSPAPDPKAALIAAIDSLVATIETFVSGIHTIPSGKSRSPLAVAALHEQLHGRPSKNGKDADAGGNGADGPDQATSAETGQAATAQAQTTGSKSSGAPDVAHVLLVKAHGGQGAQLTEHPSPLFFWKEDSFTTVVDATITFALIDVTTSQIVASGLESAAAHVNGNINGDLRIRHHSTTRDN